MDPQRQVQATLDDLVASGAETGLQVAVVHEGRLVVDAVAGLADPETGDPVTASRLFFAARAVARMYAGVLGHVPGVGLVSRERLTAMAATTFEGVDQVMGFPITWAFGYSPARPGGGPSRLGSTFGRLGSNGSAAYADIDSGAAVAVMRNRILADMDAVAAVDRIVAQAFG
jgi:CubicO group peptidase (beta-lactamase class C family)